MEIIDLTLPEFAFLDTESNPDDDILRGRDVILHIRSASVCEVFNRDEDDFILKDDAITFKFKYKYNDIDGREIVERYIIALHYSTTLDDKTDIINRILRPAAQWFCRYITAEDEGMFD